MHLRMQYVDEQQQQLSVPGGLSWPNQAGGVGCLPVGRPDTLSLINPRASLTSSGPDEGSGLIKEMQTAEGQRGGRIT